MLKHIKTLVCPICGAPPVKDDVLVSGGILRVHVNGQRWETRTFLCDEVVEWIPNFGQECRSEHKWQQCRNTPERVAEQEAKEQWRKALVEAITTLPAPEAPLSSEDREKLERALKTTVDNFMKYGHG